jgi:hypothetical protein
LNDAATERDFTVKCGRRSNYTVSAHHRSLDHLPRGQTDDQGDDGSSRKIGMTDFFVGLEQNFVLLEMGRRQMGL